MIRTIKFRAWDGVRMTTNGIAFNNSNGQMTAIGSVDLMQFTGLTDKNGTEIYEGDTDITGILVKWDEIAASFICVRDGSFIGHLGEISNLLLITGNIHENPELI